MLAQANQSKSLLLQLINKRVQPGQVTLPRSLTKAKMMPKIFFYQFFLKKSFPLSFLSLE